MGDTGPAGATGPTGATGSVSTDFGYVYNNVAQTVAAGDDVTFNNITGPFGGGVTATDTTITVANAGNYLVMYEVAPQFALLNTQTAYAITLNGAPQPSIRYGQIGSTLGDSHNLVGSAILTIPAGGTLTLRNVGGTADTLITTVDGQTVVNASISVFKLSV
ncbi:hypothetical protein PVE99_02675 [Priestia megaterium]|uniref:BclA C-terminal domain-containing protein n=1 Tax=Priestia megaterium TaxID=1404 RepID=A0ABD4WM85_PRIMG|nr:hypothetical protein [Priestia megaterium]MDD9781338.1 hypothetical protein [Priestia megaterium]